MEIPNNWWQSDKYIPFFGYKLYYKQHFLKFCKVLDLPYYHSWRHKKRSRNHQNRKNNGEKANPNWAKFRKLELAERDGLYCKECRATDKLTVDHIIPLHLKGSNELKNLQLLCIVCHDEKTKKENKEIARKKLSTT